MELVGCVCVSVSGDFRLLKEEEGRGKGSRRGEDGGELQYNKRKESCEHRHS
jgi:hypothetical protein